MKLLLSAIFALSILFGFSQDLEIEITYDSIKKCGESDYHLIYSKGKTWLYDASKKVYHIEKSKNFIHYFETQNVFMEMDAKGKCTVYSEEEGLKKDTVCFNDSRFLFHPMSGKKAFHDSLTGNISEAGSYYGLKKDGNHIFIYEWKRFMRELEEPYPLLTEYGEDSMRMLPDGTMEVIYIDLSFPDIQKSGLFDLKNNNWIAKPVFQSLYKIGNIVAGLHYIDTLGIYSFDFYRMGKKGLEDQLQNQICANKIPYAFILNNDQFRVDKDFRYVYVDNGKTLLYFDLQPMFSPNYHELEPAFFYQFNPKIDTIISDVDWVVTNGFNQQSYYYKSNGTIKSKYWSMRLEDYEYGPFEIDSSSFYSTDAHTGEYYLQIDQTVIKDTCAGNPPCYFKSKDKTKKWKDERGGISLLSDTTVYVHYHLKEYKFDDVPLMTEYGEDSIIVDEYGNFTVVYPPADPGSYESGVFDFKNQKWIIEPENMWVMRAHNGYLMEYPILDSNYNLVESKMRFIRDDGAVVFEDYDPKDMYPENAKFLVPFYEADELITAQYTHHLYGTPEWMYFKSGDKMGAFSLLNGNLIHKPEEYLFVDRHLCNIYIKDKWLYVETEFGSVLKRNLTAGSKPANLEFYTTYDNSFFLADKGTKMVFTDNRETGEVFENEMNSETFGSQFDEQGPTISFKKVDENLIYIENFLIDYDDPDLVQYDEYGEMMINEYGEYLNAKAKGYNRSGIYDLENKSWIVHAKHKKLIGYFNGVSLWLTADTTGNIYTLYNNSDDIFQGKGLESIYAHDKSENLIKELFQADSIKKADYKPDNYNRPAYCYLVYKKGKTTLFDLEKMELRAENADLIIYDSGREHCLILKNDTLISDENFFDSEKENLVISLKGKGNTYKFSTRHDSNVEIKHDERFMIVNFNDAEISLPLYTEWGEDSINANGDFVYDLIAPETNQSGVYDLQEKKWKIAPTYNLIFTSDFKTFVCRYKNGDAFSDDIYLYNVINSEGEVEHSNKIMSELPDNLQKVINQ